MTTFKALFFLLFSSSFLILNAQNNKELENYKFKDTLDLKLDVSNWLIQANGFVPVPQIITEPALGGFGLMFAAVFIKPNKYQTKGVYTPPNITAAFAGYTANDTWGSGVIRMAHIPKKKLKYRIGAAYINLNMDFYRDMPLIGEQKFSFNFNSVPVFGSLMREVRKNLYLGLQYFYLKSDITPQFDMTELPPFLKEKDFSSQISSFGIGLNFDNRDNIFTPNKGANIGANFRVNDDWTGSDYTFQNANLSYFHYFQTKSNWVSGFRFDTKFIFGDAPFYMKPSIELRGVPAARYQGESTYVLETEQRYDFTMRWSGIAFTGVGKAIHENIDFSDATLVYNYGVGFRYLLARAFHLRMGVDVAKSNDDWGYYIVFGSAWNNRN